MTGSPDVTHPAYDARSVLACGSGLTLLVGGTTIEVNDAQCDEFGVPFFPVRDDSALVGAGLRRLTATLTVSSGLGRLGDADRSMSVTVSGRLSTRGSAGCDCCADRQALVALAPDEVLLTGSDGSSRPVDVAEFTDPRHVLNRGYLQRTAEHANLCHATELRQSIAAVVGLPPIALLAASLADLTPEGVAVNWVDGTGAHRQQLWFNTPAHTPLALGQALRTELRTDIC